MAKNSGIIESTPELSSDPAPPAGGYQVIYSKTDGKVYWKTSAGVVSVIVGSSSAFTSTRVPFATTNGILIDNAGFKFDATTNELTIPNEGVTMEMMGDVPINPPAGFMKLFFSEDGALKKINGGGTVTELSASTTPDISKVLLTPTTSQTISINNSAVTSSFYQITGALSLAINGNSKLLIL